MVTLFNPHALEAIAVSNRESMADGRPGIGSTGRCATVAVRAAAAVCEFGLFLWMLAVVALSLIVMAGFFAE